MSNAFKFSALVVFFLVLVMFGSIPFKANAQSFSANFSSFTFNADGTFSCGVSGATGDFTGTTSASGTYNAMPVAGTDSQSHVFVSASSTPTNQGNGSITHSYEANFIVDSRAGTISSEGDSPTSYLRITQTMKIKGKYVVTVSQSASGLGNFTSWQYDTTSGSMTGTF